MSSLDPTGYPFDQPDGSYLLVGEDSFPVVRVSPASLGDWVLDLGSHQGTAAELSRSAPIAAALQRPRRPVIGYGSNPSQAVLSEKLASESEPPVVPVLEATLHDFDAVYSAHISPKAIVPATLYPSPGTDLRVFVMLLDDEQIDRVDKTEPNYDRLLLAEPGALRVMGAPHSGEAYVYVSKWGVLDVDGVAARVAGIEAEQVRFESRTELQILDDVKRRLGSGETSIADFVAESEDRDVASERTRILSGDAHQPSFEAIDRSPLPSLAVRPTTSTIRAAAARDVLVAISPDLKRELGIGHHAVLSRDVGDGLLGLRRLTVLCRVVESGELTKSEIAVDQSVRNAVGIRFGAEQPEAGMVALRPVTARWARLRDSRFLSWLGWRYLLMRVTSADVPDMEKQFARIPADAFALLGSTSGDQLKIESVTRTPAGPYEIRDQAVRAYALTGEVIERRRAKSLPYFGARWPDAEAVLGIDPDIYPIYLDAQDRQRLQADAFDVVVVRRNVKHLLIRELREFGLAFFLSLFGFRTLFDSVWIFLPAALAFALAFSIANIRARAGVH